MSEGSSQPVEFDVPLSGGAVTGGPAGIGADWEEIAEEIAADLGEPGSDPAVEFRRTLGRFATGVTIVTTQAGDQVHGMTANAFMSVSLQPPLVLVSVDRRAKLNRLLYVGSVYGVSILSEHQHVLSDRFAGRPMEEEAEIEFDLLHGAPLVQGALAHVVARVVKTYWGGDHALFLGQVEYARYGEGRPLLFHGGRYEHLRPVASPLFAALPPEVWERMLTAGRQQMFAAGETVARAGEPGDELLAVLNGEARVEAGGQVVARLGPGDFFGEATVLDGGVRPADVVAETTLRCVTVPRNVVRAAVLSDPEAAWELLRDLAARLRAR